MTLEESNATLLKLRAVFQGERGGIQWFRVNDRTRPGGWYWVGRVHTGNSVYELREHSPAGCGC